MRKSQFSAGIVLCAGTLGVVGLGSSAFGYLGSFTSADGYTSFYAPSGYNWSDVSYINAGAYGANAGGGPGPMNIVPDSGQWRVNPGFAGGFFDSYSTRAAWLSSSPPYPSSNPSGQPAYLVGNHFGGRTDNSCLAFRNEVFSGSGPASYRYQLDTYDFGGVSPASVTSGQVNFKMYFFPNPDVPAQAGMRQPPKFVQALMDSSGNVGMEWGYARDNEMIWRVGSGPWNYTGTVANVAWDGMNITLDLSAQTFSFDYYNWATSTWSTLVPTTGLGATMANLTQLDWTLADSVTGGLGGKNLFDDAGFTVVPTPGVAGLFGVFGLAMGRRARRM